MRLTRTLLAILILTPVVPAAELSTLDGRKVTGDIVSVTGNDLTFKAGATEEKFLVTAIQSITTGANSAAPASGTKHTTVELLDGTLLRCSEIVIKGGNIELKLLTMPVRTLTVPMRPAVLAINREAGDIKLDQDFRTLMRARSKFDTWITKGKTTDNGKEIDRLDGVPGTFGEGDAAAETVKFTLEGGKDTELRMSRVSGLIFNQKPEAAPPAICKVIDTNANEYVVQAVARTDKGYAVTTVTGVKVDLDNAQVSKFDFAAGSVKYLSDLEPVGLDESGSDPEHYQKDKNLDKRPIRLMLDPAAGKSETYPKGLTLKAKTAITYELKGQYKTFRALAGVDADPDNAAPSQVKVTIDDGTQVLFKGVVKKGDKPLDLNLAVQNVERLKITVESDGSITDLGNQVSLANARVLK